LRPEAIGVLVAVGLAIVAFGISLLLFYPDSTGKVTGKIWWQKQTDQQRKVWKTCGLLFMAMLFLGGVLTLALLDSGSSSGDPSGYRYLSQSTREKIYYDIVATQDQNPYSNEWNEGVKQAAADYYDVPLSQINTIIREGATNNWLTPEPTY